MKVALCRLFIWVFMVATLSLAAGERDVVRTQITGATATIENGRVRLIYDLKTGEYSAIDKTDGEFRISKARLKGCCAASAEFIADETFRHAAQEQDTRDELGDGKSLLIRSSAAGKPTLLLKITFAFRVGRNHSRRGH